MATTVYLLYSQVDWFNGSFQVTAFVKVSGPCKQPATSNSQHQLLTANYLNAVATNTVVNIQGAIVSKLQCKIKLHT